MFQLKKVRLAMENIAVATGNMLKKERGKIERVEKLPAGKDFLTAQDLKAEQMIIDSLTSVLPEAKILAEERGGERVEEGYVWIIDPIDGTINYFQGNEYWGVSIALVKDGKTSVGVVYYPALGFLCSGEHGSPSQIKFDGKGDSERKWEPLQVNRKNYSTLEHSQVWVDWGKETKGGRDHARILRLLAAIDLRAPYPQLRNSSVASAIQVALGRIGAYIAPKLEPWDIAAVALLVEGAGGKVTDLEGETWSPFSPGIIASNGVLHEELLELVRLSA